MCGSGSFSEATYSEATYTDEELFRKFRVSGDNAAMAELTERHHDRLLAMAKRLLFPDSDRRHKAEDVVQDAFIIAMTRCDAFDDNCQFAPWINGIVFHECSNERRRSRRRPCLVGHIQDDLIDEQIKPLDEFSELAEDITLAFNSLEHLPENQQEIIKLHVKGLNIKEIGHLLNQPYQSVWYTLKQGLKGIRKRMKLAS